MPVFKVMAADVECDVMENASHPVDLQMTGRDRKKIMKAASDLMDGERAQNYGDAYEMHRRIASGWTEILGVEVKPHEVALCMAWLKIARLVETPGHEDSYIDLVAYGSLAGEIQAKDSAKSG